MTSWQSVNLHLMVCDEGTPVNWHKYRYIGYRAAYLILPDDNSTPSFQDVFNQIRWWKMSNIWVSITINETLNLTQVQNLSWPSYHRFITGIHIFIKCQYYKTETSQDNPYLPMTSGGREVKSRLYNIRYIWSIITDPENPQYSWYQKIRNTKVCKTEHKNKLFIG